MTTVAVHPARQLDTLPAGNPEFTLGPWAVWWAHKWLRQPNGANARKPFRFTPRQIKFLNWWYAVDVDGRFLFNHGVRRLAKGSGKSPFAGAWGLIELCAPVRLAYLDVTKSDQRLEKWGWTVGEQVSMPWVQIAATAESQTVNTMRMVRAFAPRGSAVVQEHRLDPGKTRYHRVPEGTLEVITSSATAAEGAQSTAVIGDETEHWRPSNGGVDLASTLEDNLAKSASRMLETSNAWIPGQESVAESTFDAWAAQQEGRTRGNTRILYDAVIADPKTDLSDPGLLEAALSWVYADCPWVDPVAIMERIWNPKAKPSESKRKYLNWPTVAEDAWVDPVEWNRLADPDRNVADGERVVLFFDGSKSRDASALIGCTLDDGHIFTVDVWEPDPKRPDWTVDIADVDRVVAKTFERLDVVAFFSDVREVEQLALTSWPQQYGDQLKVWAVPRGRPAQPIAWDMRGHGYEFAKATEACHAEIVEGSFTHDGDPRTARHVGNARRRPYRDAVAIGKESPDSPRKIDAAICVIGARMVRRIAMGSGKLRRVSGEAVFV